MSATIDQRILSMKFDNKQFESGVGTSINTLSKLEKSLDLTESAKGLNAIGDAANKVSFDGMGRGIETAKLKFSALQVVAITTLTNITNSAINTGKQLLSALTIDPIADGYADYGRKLTSMQTITNATGESLKTVGKYFNELDVYADKTVYNLDDMTSSFAKFTNAGVSMDKSVPAIKGIANMVALAGQDASAAQIAMYNLSQSIAGGFLTRMDFKSLELANVATKEWKGQMIAGAIAAGTLKKSTNGMYSVKGASEAVTENELFIDSLSKGWATTDVLLKVLGEYGDTTTDIGAKAQSAAQDVKSWGMMMDTLKASAGTGWTDTFEILVGDLNEAKALYTPLTNTISSILDSITETRNSLLGGWKELGGRTEAIEAVKNSFQGVSSIVKTIGGAFRDIFPPTTSKQLYDLTVGFKNLTEHFKLSESTLNNLKSTFKGFFAILDIGKTIASAVINAIGIMFGGVGNLSSSILVVTGSFGEWISMFSKVISQSDVLNKVLATLAYGVRNGLNGISYVLELILGGIGSVMTVLSKNIKLPGFESVNSVLKLLGDRMTGVGKEANSMSNKVGRAFVSMGKSVANSKIGTLFTSIWKTVKMVTNEIGKLTGKMADSISTSLNNADFSGLLDAVAAISIGGMLLSFKKFMGSLSETIGDFKSVFSNVKGILDDVRGSLEAYQQKIKANILLKIGVAVSLLAASIVAISLIDSGKLVSSLAAIGTLFTQLLIATKVYSLIGKLDKSVVKSSIVMLNMSVAILFLSKAMKNISNLDWNGIAKGSVGIVVMAGTLVAAAKLLSSGSGSMIKGSTGMIGFVLALKLLASIYSKMAQLDWNGIAKGSVGIITMAGTLVTVAKLLSKNNGTMIKGSVGMIGFALAIKVLASDMNDIGNMSWESIAKSSIGVIAMAGTLVAVAKLLSQGSGLMIKGSVGIIGFTLAIKILASVMNDIGEMSWESIAKGSTGILTMAGTLVASSILLSRGSGSMIKGSIGMAAFALSIKVLASSMVIFGNMSLGSIVKSLTILGGSLGILSIGLTSMNKTVTGSASLLIAAGALAVLAPVLTSLGAMSWGSIIKGLVELSSTIAIFGISAAVLTPIIPSMFALSSSLILLGVSMLGIGAGLALVGVGLSGVAAGFTLLAGTSAVSAAAIVTSLGIIITGVAALIPAVMGKIGEGIIAFCKVITDGTPAILECISVILKATIDCIVTNTPLIINGVLKILASVLDSIIKWVPTIIQKVANLIIALLKVIADNVPKFVTSAVDIIVAVAKGIIDNLFRIIDAAFKLIITFINGLADAIRNNSGAIGEACLNLVNAIVGGIGNLGYKFIKAGADAVKGFIDGLLSLPGKIWDAGCSIGKAALAGAKKAIDSNSPSKEFAKLGVFSGQGFVNGLDKYNNKVADAGNNMGRGAVDAMSNAISGISNMVDSNMESQPVIRPVLDLTDIQNGSNKLYNLIGDMDNYNLNGSVNPINSTVRQIRKEQLISNPILDETINSNNHSLDNSTNTKKPMVLQLVLQNGRAIAEYIIDDVDNLMGTKNKITERMVGA